MYQMKIVRLPILGDVLAKKHKHKDHWEWVAIPEYGWEACMPEENAICNGEPKPVIDNDEQDLTGPRFIGLPIC